MSEKIFKLDANEWNTIGQLAIKLERQDIRRGIMQDGQSNLHYKSETYKKYKANDMRKFGRGEKRKGRGERLKQYKGLSISSKETGFVNLTLTGRMLNDMYQRVVSNGVEIHFASKDAGKVLGAEEQGRKILTLRDENLDKIEDELVKIFNKNVSKLKEKKLHISI